jgi:hypothetical protein
MVDYRALMEVFSLPRPNGSEGEETTAQKIQDWLKENGIPYRIQEFCQYPYFFECIGVWVSLVIALIVLPGGLVDFVWHIPLITWPGVQKGKNFLIEFNSEKADKEIIFCAHYDSKTELLDHRQRMFFLKNIPTGIVLTILVGFLEGLDGFLRFYGLPFANITYGFSTILTLPLIFISLGLGINLAVGRLLPSSQGAVDNGAACATLLGFAKDLITNYDNFFQSRSEIAGWNTNVSILLFTGEEVNMQGSRAYVSSRDWKLPVWVINLEVMAQNGDYVVWEEDGSIFKRLPTTSEINEAIFQSIRSVSGKKPLFAGPITSDGGSFLMAGLPATTLGTYDKQLKEAGFHRPTDNLGRVVIPRLPEGATILRGLLASYIIKT